MQIWKHKKTGGIYVRYKNGTYYNKDTSRINEDFVIFYAIGDSNPLVLELSKFLMYYINLRM